MRKSQKEETHVAFGRVVAVLVWVFFLPWFVAAFHFWQAHSSPQHHKQERAPFRGNFHAFFSKQKERSEAEKNTQRA